MRTRASGSSRAAALALLSILCAGGRPATAPAQDPPPGGVGLVIQESGLSGLDVSRDGKTLALCAGNEAWLVDAETGASRGPRVKHDRPVLAVAVASDGKTLLTGSGDETARLWDGVTGKPLSPPLPHRFDVRCVAFAPDGKTFYTSGRRSVTAWDVQALRPNGPSIVLDEQVEALAASPDGRALLVATYDRNVYLLDALTGKADRAPRQLDAPAGSVAFSDDGKKILTASDAAAIWDASNWDIIARIAFPDAAKDPNPHGGEAQQYAASAALSPDGKFLLVAWNEDLPRSKLAGRGFVQLYDAASREPRGRPVPDAERGSTLLKAGFSKDGKSWYALARGEARFYRVP